MGIAKSVRGRVWGGFYVGLVLVLFFVNSFKVGSFEVGFFVFSRFIVWNVSLEFFGFLFLRVVWFWGCLVGYF